MFGKLFGRAPAEARGEVRPPPAVPEGLRLYVVGDVHGRFDLLTSLRDLVACDLAGFDGPVATVFLGDYVDRGPASRQVLSLLAAHDWPTPMVALRGNHEAAFLSFIADANAWGEWQNYGALPTLASYGVDVRPLMGQEPTPEVLAAVHAQLLAALPPEHLAFLRALHDCTAAGDYFFCHAGVRPGVPIEHQGLFDLMTIREPFLSCELDFGKVVVHGHTPQEAPCVRTNRIGIDTGAYATGRLTALVLEGQSRSWLQTGSPGARRGGP